MSNIKNYKKHIEPIKEEEYDSEPEQSDSDSDSDYDDNSFHGTYQTQPQFREKKRNITYGQRILEAFENVHPIEPLEYEEIMEEVENTWDDKKKYHDSYFKRAITSGLTEKSLTQIKIKGVRTKYKGHKYIPTDKYQQYKDNNLASNIITLDID